MKSVGDSSGGGLLAQQRLDRAAPGNSRVHSGVTSGELGQRHDEVVVPLYGVQVPDGEQQAIRRAQPQLGTESRGNAVRRAHTVGHDRNPIMSQPEIGTE